MKARGEKSSPRFFHRGIPPIAKSGEAGIFTTEARRTQHLMKCRGMKEAMRNQSEI
jgi:hypothetical protein